MNCNVHASGKTIFSNKFGFILETVFSYNILPICKLRPEKFFLYWTLFLFFLALKALEYDVNVIEKEGRKLAKEWTR